MICQHLKFNCECKVGRLQEVEDGPVTHFTAEIMVTCADCGAKFQWQGLPMGASAYRPTVSLDGFELRAPIMPEGKSVPKGILSVIMRTPTENNKN